MPRCLHPAGGHRLRSIKSGGDSELATQRAVRLRRGGATLEDIARLARDLKGIRVCHINSTEFGGGVAELLARYVPMASALGIDTDWRLLHRTTEFFTITKALHNALQVAPYGVSETDKPIYIHVNRESAASLDARTIWSSFTIRSRQPFGRWRANEPRSGSGAATSTRQEAATDDDLFVFTNLAGVGSMEVNAFQRRFAIQRAARPSGATRANTSAATSFCRVCCATSCS